MTLLERLEAHLVSEILSPIGQAQYQAGNVASKELAPYVTEIRSISERYIHHKVGSSLPSPVTSPRGAHAYALYYTPINAAKVAHLLSELPAFAEKVSVLDLGCGPGTATLALLARTRSEVSVTCIESSREMRAIAEPLIRSFPGTATLSSLTILSDLRALNNQQFDLIIAANVLAELSASEAHHALSILSRALSERGHLLLIEPGQSAHTRRLMSLRDMILAAHPDITPLFPCTRTDACPMLTTSESDWCHGEIEWQQPRLHAQLDTLLGFNKHRIKYSGFLFERGGTPRDGVRVLTPPRKTNVGVETLVCGKDLYGTVRISKRNRSERTKPFEKADVFDRLLFSRSVSPGEAPADLEVVSALLPYSSSPGIL